MFDNVIQKPALRKCTQVSLSRLNLTQTVVESLKLKTQNLMLFSMGGWDRDSRSVQRTGTILKYMLQNRNFTG